MARGRNDAGTAVNQGTKRLTAMLIRHRTPLSQSHRRGFSMIETTIVIGIIGIILAAVFQSLTSTQTEGRISQAIDQLGIISNNVRSYYSGRAVPSGLVACPSTFSSANLMPGSTWLAAEYKSYGIFPTDMLFISGTNAHVNNPWNIGSATSTVMVDLCGSNPVQFAVRYMNLSAQACENLVVQGSALASGMRLYQIVVTPSVGATTFITQIGSTNTGVNPASGAVYPVNAATACFGGAKVDWYYKLNG